MILTYIVLIALLILAIIDLKFKAVPSIMTTALIFISALVTQNIYFGILGALFGLMLYDMEYIGGLADIKLLGLTGLFISDLKGFFLLMIVFIVLGNVWKFGILKILKKGQREETAFIPAIFFTYLALLLLGVLV